jgi:hypothetical protein
MTFLKLRDQSGATVIINTGPGPWLYISQAADPDSKTPIFGFSAIFFQGQLIQAPNGQVQPYGIVVRGTPEEIAGEMQLMTGFTFEHASH